jgi:hypothetical protein
LPVGARLSTRAGVPLSLIVCPFLLQPAGSAANHCPSCLRWVAELPRVRLGRIAERNLSSKLGPRRWSPAAILLARIVCLTEETVETLYLLGEDSRIVGISGYVVRPLRARREKPRVSAFTSATSRRF